uniref:Nucleolar protein 6 n=1 Tax=Phallusia mammillata TaxID=59560 RepID=A0A6F9DNB1_9ASCI|nr:nucleolar protein 6-like [Phallusia mammillata]
MHDMAMTDVDGPPPAKLSRSELYKPPTNEELMDLRETEMLFHSNLVKLEIKETLKEISLHDKKRAEIDVYLHSLHETIMSSQETESAALQSMAWLDSSSVSFPFVCNPTKVKGNMKFLKPSEIKLIGSYQLDSCLKHDLNVDLLLIMPKDCFQAKDHLNQRYLRKCALYLAHVASHLANSSLVFDIQFSYFGENPMKPIVLITPPPGVLNNITVRLHACLEPGCLKLERFSPDKSNVRQTWYTGAQPTADEAMLPTPHYNSCILMDMLMESHLYFLYETSSDFQSFKDAVKLLKVWLRQRDFDKGYGSFNGFIMSMLISYLVSTNKINKLMSSYQIIRNTFQYLGSSNWNTNGISLNKNENLSNFHNYFEVVFVDPSGTLNLCADMPLLVYQQVCHEARLSLDALDDKQSGFSSVFLKQVSFVEKYDQIIKLTKTGILRKTAERLQVQDKVLDHGSNCIAATLTHITSMLRKGLGNRIQQLGIKMHSYKPWKIDEEPPKWKEVETNLTFGFLLNQESFSDVLERGPSADSPEAVVFREFWGEKSELRRFKDGAICEAVVWKSNSVSEKREIPFNICKFLLKRHCDINPSAVKFLATQFEDFLKIPQRSIKNGTKIGFVGTGEEAFQDCSIVFNDLCSRLRNLTTLPLSITNLQGVSPVLRHTEVYPPCKCTTDNQSHAIRISQQQINVPVPEKKCPAYVSPIEVICHMEGSGKWPQEAAALRRLKAAFHIAMSDELKQNHPKLICIPAQTHVDVLMDGHVFRICVAYHREVTILQTHTTPDGMVKIRNTPQSLEIAKQTVHLPLLSSSINGLRQNFQSYSGSCRLAKCWINSQLLSTQITSEAVELLVAHLYTNPYPYTAPGSAQAGFLRFLRFCTSLDFAANPVIVDFNNDLSKSDYESILQHFKQNREALPPLSIITSKERTQSLWTTEKPSKVILRRLKDLAQICLKSAESFLSSENTVDLTSICTPSLGVYDVIIHLRSCWLPRRHEQIAQHNSVRRNHNYEDDETMTLLPVVGFDPVQIYLSDLENCFGDLALFFHDDNGGSVIGVLWRPNAFQPKQFKLSTASCVEMLDGDKCAPSVHSVLEDFKIMGRGLVENIELHSDKWKI